MGLYLGYALFGSPKKKLYFDYNSHAGMAYPRLYEGDHDAPTSVKGMFDATCTHTPEAVVLWTGYGGGDGFWWNASACRACMLIVDGNHPFRRTSDDKYGLPLPTYDGKPEGLK